MSDSQRFQDAQEYLKPRMAERNAGFWCPDGWLDLVLETDARLLAVNPDYRIVQVKEKFGGLRYYIDGKSDEARAIIREAEERSLGICQNCGSTEDVGSVDSGWVATLCRGCAESADRWQDRGY